MAASSARDPAQRQIRRQRRRKLLLRLDVLFTLFLAGLLLIMLNFLSFNRHWRMDVSQTHFYSLSPQTQSLLKNLEEPFEIYLLMERDHSGFEDIERLLREYDASSPAVQVQWVDIHGDYAYAEELTARFELNEENVIVLSSRDRRRILNASEFYEETETGINETTSIRSFLGEQIISSALRELNEGAAAKVYFLGGHGEHDLTSFDPYRGYSGIAKAMNRENIDALPLILGDVSTIPRDADALVIAGPTKRYSRQEKDLLQDYLSRSGRMVLLLNAFEDSGLTDFLRPWGVALQQDLVVDGTRTLTGKELFLTSYETHPITRGMQGVTSVLYLPRSIRPVQSEQAPADRPRFYPLAACSENGWAELTLEENPKTFDPIRDIPGPVPVAAAIERGALDSMDLNLSPSRLVVFGDSDFISNAGLNGGDTDFFMNALDWTLEREPMMGIRPRSLESVRLTLDRNQARHLAWMLVAGLPAVIACMGLLVWSVRRRG